MARYTGPKNKLARAHKRDLGLTTNVAKLERRLQIKPGQHGQKGFGRKLSEYGIQLAEKQKVKRIYGILEKQFRNYYTKARKTSKATGTKLLQLLEMRLDNIVYRLGFAPTRTSARQFTSHGHVMVNGKKVNIPSYPVKIGDTITISKKIAENPDVKKLLTDKKYELPKWLERKAIVGKVIREPQREEVGSDIKEQLIIEFYSR
jgi:small subunit ribosomal protein S4